MSGQNKRTRSKKLSDCPVIKGRGSSDSNDCVVVNNNKRQSDVDTSNNSNKSSRGRKKEKKIHQEYEVHDIDEGELKIISQDSQSTLIYDGVEQDEPMVIDFTQSSSGGRSTQVSKVSDASSDLMVVENAAESSTKSEDVSKDEEAEDMSKKGKRRRKRSPSPVFTLRRDVNEPLKNFDNDCDTDIYHGYVPSTSSGDVIEWMPNKSRTNSGNSSIGSKKGGRGKGKKKDNKESNDPKVSPIKNPPTLTVNGLSYSLLSAKCKGCHENFIINNDNSLLKIYLSHCIKECTKYQSMNLIKYCDPCNLYCMDREAFVCHGKSDLDCPMNDTFNFWSKRWYKDTAGGGGGKKGGSVKEWLGAFKSSE